MFCMETLFESAVVCCDLLLLNIEVTVLSSGASIAERGRSFGCEPGKEVSEKSQLMQLHCSCNADDDLKESGSKIRFFLESSPGDPSC